MKQNKILYVVNNDTTTGVALEVGDYISKKLPHFHLIIYYKHSPYPSYLSDQKLINIGANNFFDLKAIKSSYRLIRKMQPTIIHAHHTISAFIYFILGKITCPSAKLIKTVHSSHSSLTWVQKFLTFFIYIFANTILCNSESTKNSFPALFKYLFFSKIKVSYNGINIHKIKNSEITQEEKFKLLSGKNGEFIIGTVGRFIKVKDHETLIKSFAELKLKTDKELKLLLIGDGRERKKLERLARNIDIREAVIFTGALERRLVYGLLKEIDVFVLTSIEEGFCNALVEALAAKKAIVCSEIEVFKEIGGEAVQYADPGNPRSFSQEVLKILDNGKLYQEMKIEAGKRAEKFTIEACATRYKNHYS